jgi:hypothetical protein
VRRRDPDSAAALDRWLALLCEAHEDRILPIDRAIAEEWGRMNVPDLCLSSTACRLRPLGSWA